MSSDAKPSIPTTHEPTPQHREKGIRIFMWPKVIFLYPTAIVALICAAGMQIIGDRVHDPARPISEAVETRPVTQADGAKSVHAAAPPFVQLDRCRTPQNLLGMLFLAMLAFNLLTMGLDLPRFSIIAVIFGILFLVFFLLWLGIYFKLDLLRPIHALIAHIYAVANRGFYVMVFVTLMFVFGIIWLTRLPRLLGDPAERDPPQPRPVQRPGAVPDHEPEVRQGDPGRAGVHASLGRRPAGAARAQRLQGDRDG